MRDTGVFELFIPGLAAGCGYMYEIKRQGKGDYKKVRPCIKTDIISSIIASVVSDENMPDSYAWNDGLWMIKRKKEAGKKKPVTVYEVSLTDWLKEKKCR